MPFTFRALTRASSNGRTSPNSAPMSVVQINDVNVVFIQ